MARSSSSDRDPDEDPKSPRRLLRDARRRVQKLREQYWQERIFNGTVSERTHRQLAAAAMQYRDLLMDYRDEDHLRPPWEERGVDWITQYVDEYVTRERPSPGRGGGPVEERVPAIVEVDHRRIYQLTKRLDKIWRDLGLGATLEADVRRKAEIPYDEEKGEGESAAEGAEAEAEAEAERDAPDTADVSHQPEPKTEPEPDPEGGVDNADD